MAEDEPQEVDLPWLEETGAPRPGRSTALALGSEGTAVVTALVIAALVVAGILYFALRGPGHADTDKYPATVELPTATPSATPAPSATPTRHAAPARHRTESRQEAAPSPVPAAGEGASRHRDTQVASAPPVRRHEKQPRREPAARPAPSRVSSRPLAGETIQLAAFPRPEQSAAYWDRVTHRHAALGHLRHQVIEARVRGRTVYRLRAAGEGAHALCDRLRRAGTACMIVGH